MISSRLPSRTGGRPAPLTAPWTRRRNGTFGLECTPASHCSTRHRPSECAPPTEPVHPEEKLHAQVPFDAARRRAGDRVCLRPRRGTVQQHVLLRRQRDRRRFVQAGPAPGHRPLHDQSGRSVGSDARQPLRVLDHAGEPGRHRLRAGRRARHADAGLSAAGADGRRGTGRDAGVAGRRQGYRRQRLLRRPGRLQRPLHRVRPAAGRPDHVGAAAGQRRARRHAACPAGRHAEGERRELHLRHESLRHRQVARRRRRRSGPRGPDFRASPVSTTARSTPRSTRSAAT